MLLTVLFACGTAPLPTPDGDSGDPAPDAPREIAPGPDCLDEAWPVAVPFNVLAGHLVDGQASDEELAALITVVEEWAPPRQGPWAHTVRGPWRATDGVAFAGGGDVLGAASVPDVARRDDGTFVMLYVDGDLDRLVELAGEGAPLRGGLLGFGGLGAATSAEGTAWSPVELSFAEPLPTYAVDPELQRLEDGRWALYFLGVPAEELCADVPDPFAVPTPHRLYRAESDDLLNWGPAEVVATHDEGGVDPAVWCVDPATCYAWFSTPLQSGDGGRTWTPSTALSFVSPPQVPDVLGMQNGEFLLYGLGGEGVGVSASSDGLAFTPVGLTGAGWGSPTAAAVDDEVWLWVAGE